MVLTTRYGLQYHTVNFTCIAYKKSLKHATSHFYTKSIFMRTYCNVSLQPMYLIRRKMKCEEQQVRMKLRYPFYDSECCI